jgi:hypothetical protein
MLPPSLRTRRNAASVPVAGAMTANSDCPRRPMASEERPTRFNSWPTCSAMRCASSSGDSPASLPSAWAANTTHARGSRLRNASAPISWARRAKRLAVYRLTQEFPRPSPIGFEALRPSGGTRCGDNDGSSGAEPRIAAELAAHLEPMHVGHLGVEDNEIRLRGADPLESLLASIGANDRVTAGPQNALERPCRPFLIVGDKDQRRGGGLFSISHAHLPRDEKQGIGYVRPRSRSRAPSAKRYKPLLYSHLSFTAPPTSGPDRWKGATVWMLECHGT